MNVAIKTSQINIYTTLYLALLFSLNLFLNNYLFYPETYLIFILLLSILTLKNIHNSLTFTKLFFFILIFISLCSPTRDWDARSIWMFHAKKIFFEQNIFSQFDNYGFQNEYPIFISYYSAQLARLAGNWNDILPKLSSFLLAIPCMIYLSEKSKNKIHELIIISLYTIFFGKALINGEADALLGLYFTSIFFLLFLDGVKLSFEKKNILNVFFLISLIIIFSNLKTNSFILLIILTISGLLFLKNKNRTKIFLFSLFLSLIPLAYFKYNVLKFNISGTFFKSFLDVNFFDILTNFSELLIIINEIFINKYFVFTLFIIFIFIYSKKESTLKNYNNFFLINFNKKFNFIYAAILICLLHIIFLISVLMVLSSEVYFDIVVLSLQRYMFPILFFLSYIVIYAIFKDYKKKKN